MEPRRCRRVELSGGAILVGIDIGGTFTDAAFARSDGTLEILKVPSTPRAPEDGVNEAFARLGVDPRSAERFVHGTTIITNLLIERTGGRVALVTTAGFEDVLEMQTGDKPNTYDITWTKPAPFVPRPLCLGVEERVDWAGEVLVPLAQDEIGRLVARLRELECDAVAVSLLNAHANGAHERALRRAIGKALPGVHCCISTDVDPGIREYERTSTTVLNAYAMPSVTEYVEGRAAAWGDVHYMSSRGGAVDAAVAARLPISLAFSGPAGGVVGAAALAEAGGYGDLITFDMGGTSTDVTIVRGGSAELRRTTDVEWGIPYRFPSLDIKSVGAGGGSVLWIDSGGALRVGPRSAGVAPGPACYGRGGEEATVTDVNLLLGLLPGDSLGFGSIVLRQDAAERALGRLAEALRTSASEAAFGAWRIVNANMAQAIREITVYKGIDPREFSLFCFGSAAGQHAVEVAREMRLRRVVVPAAASVFSAVGMLSARLEVYGSRPVDSLLGDLFGPDSPLPRVLELERDVRASQGAAALAERTWTLECRHVGQTHTLDIPFEPGRDDEASLRERFRDEHARLYGVRGEAGIEVVNARLALASGKPAFSAWRPVETDGAGAAPDGEQEVWMERGPVPVLRRAELEAGESGAGPVLVTDATSTVYVPGDARFALDALGSLVVELGWT